MSSPDFKGYKKWQRDNCGWHLQPSGKKVKRKHFRCVRRIIKQKLKSGEWSTTDPTNRGSFIFSTSAESYLKSRQEKKEKKLQYFECGNRHLTELHCNTPTYHSAGHIMVNDSWQYIQSK